MLGNVEVTRVREAKANDRCLMVKVRAPREIASRIAASGSRNRGSRSRPSCSSRTSTTR